MHRDADIKSMSMAVDMIIIIMYTEKAAVMDIIIMLIIIMYTERDVVMITGMDIIIMSMVKDVDTIITTTITLVVIMDHPTSDKFS